MNEWNWRVVLVRPRNPLNIGAAARALANFGFRELVVVAPFGPTWRETRSAVGAEELIRSARAVDTLDEAVADRTMMIGTTSGSRRNLDRELISLQELPAWLSANAGSPRRVASRSKPAPAALLFGSEKTGLSNEHLSYCHALVRIPTSPVCPSMNLGQAVAVCCYELARTGAVSSQSPALRQHISRPTNMQSLDHLLTRAVSVLDQTGYLQPKSRDAMIIKLRRLLVDLRLTNNDAKILGGVLAQVEWKLGISND
ncbi:MAG TPA: TrmJ/YjtD family RNA methyltransferase [Terriglobia bacterium]|nr:TrmJ/YjtD family RNA methyltransferase [Terriglobia bacterium]